MQSLTLTADQQAAADAFSVFMASPEKTLTISGSAGVGKTTLLKHLLESKDYIKVAQLLGMTPLEDWEFTATTNKAAEVLSQSLGIEARTIHSLLGIKVQPDFTTGATKLIRGGRATVIENKLIVIDEASLIDRQLMKMIEQSTHNCKFLFLGDHCQLAPVGEAMSPVFEDKAPIVINQIVRAANSPPILNLCKQLRETVETGVFKPIEEVPGYIEYLDPAQAQDKIQEYFLNPDLAGTARMLCYTNKMVNGLNGWLRDLRGLPEQFVEGERLVSNAATYYDDKNTMARVEQDIYVQQTKEGFSYEFNVSKVIYNIPYYTVVTGEGELRIPYSKDQLNSLMNHFKKLKDWVTYFRLKEDFADLRPRDVCTVHKAQGSTYDTVFVHLDDIGTCTNAAQAARMLYVACSRPTSRIYFIGQLPKRFSGD